MIKKLNEDQSLKFKNISVEEKSKKGILGRLYGTVATWAVPTRNGRYYSSDLWEKLFGSKLILERFENGGIFGELCHPDREEVDMEKVAIVMPEPPTKDKDGNLVGYVDIVDTPCGRIAYQLAKYGYKFGISSRGSGDLVEGINGEEVDPDTYSLTAFDLVEVPGVEAARLSFTESLDTKKYNKTLRQKLTEQLESASEEDKKVMEESLDSLGIKLNEDGIVNDADLDSIKDEVVPENIDIHDEIEIISDEEADKIYDGEVNGKYPVMTGRYIIKHEPGEKVVAIDNSTEDAWTEEFDSEEEAIKWLNGEFEISDRLEDDSVEEQFYLRHEDIDKARDSLLNKVDHEELLKALLAKGMNDKTIEDLCRQFGVEDKEFGYNIMTPDEMESKYGTRDIKDLLKDESISENCGDKEVITESNDAGNAGDELLVNELQEALVKASELEKDNLSLQEKLSVCSAKEVNLTEELKKYKASTATLSETAKEVKSLKEENTKLTEDLGSKEKLLESNKQRFERLVNQKKEYLIKLDESSKKITDLENQVVGLNENLEKASKKAEVYEMTIKKYKKALNESRDSYIKAKADAYNLNVEDVKANLNESYQLKEVDSICETLYNQKKNLSKLPFRITEDTKINVKASSNESIKRDKFFDDDNIDSLLKMTNLLK